MTTAASKRIPAWLPANGQDYFNYMARYTASNYQLQGVLEFPGRLREDLLARALRLSCNAEPVLGCRFVEDEQHPYWQRMEDLDDRDWCPVVMAGELGQAQMLLDEYLREPMDPERDPQVKAKLFRLQEGAGDETAGWRDRLVVKVNHFSCDGAAVKEYLALIASIYSKLEEDPGYTPEPNLRGKRSVEQLFMELGILLPGTAFDPEQAALAPAWCFPWKGGEPAGPRMAIRRVEPASLVRLKEAGRSLGATVNDMLLAAYFASLYDLVQPVEGAPMDITVTVDLRRFLSGGRAEALCNLSGSVCARMDRRLEEPFPETVARAAAVMRACKEGRPGVHTAASMELLAELGFEEELNILRGMRAQSMETSLCSPMLSNLGVLPEEALVFGDRAASRAYIVTPAMFAPGLMLGASTYRGELTLTVSYYESTTELQDIERLLEGVVERLG